MLKEKEFWNKRYNNGLGSGSGSLGELRRFKWDNILKHITLKNASIFDFGCGDLSFWKKNIHPSIKEYTGYDISKTIIDRHNKDFESSEHINFTNKLMNLKPHNIVFCFDVLFHILKEGSYLSTLENLMSLSDDLLFIYTWKENPLRRQFKFPPFSKKGFIIKLNFLKKETDNKYQRYRNFDDYIAFFTHRNFHLIHKYYDENIDEFGCLYVFKKRKKVRIIN